VSGGDRGVLTVDEAEGLAVWPEVEDAAPLPKQTGWLLPVGVFHLLTADDDLTQRPFQFRMRATLRGEVVQPSSLPPSPFPEGGEIDRGPRYCSECAREAVRWNAEADDHAGTADQMATR
jgi:hypothetical protein